jgi:hypothetical protein
MRKVFTKENSSCQAFVNVNFNGVLKFSGTLKIRGFDTFAISKSREGGYHNTKYIMCICLYIQIYSQKTQQY